MDTMQTPPRWWQRPVAFPDAYCWYVLACALDLMLTNFAITHAGAVEVNAVAAGAIELAGYPGLIALKVATMLVVIGVCEIAVAQRPRVARAIAEWAGVVSALPVALTLAQLAIV